MNQPRPARMRPHRTWAERKEHGECTACGAKLVIGSVMRQGVIRNDALICTGCTKQGVDCTCEPWRGRRPN